MSNISKDKPFLNFEHARTHCKCILRAYENIDMQELLYNMIQCAFQIGIAQKVLLAITCKRRHENRVTSSDCLLIIDKNKWKEEEEKVVKYSDICIEYRNKLDKL